jgi:hypothetical protein
MKRSGYAEDPGNPLHDARKLGRPEIRLGKTVHFVEKVSCQRQVNAKSPLVGPLY